MVVADTHQKSPPSHASQSLLIGGAADSNAYTAPSITRFGDLGATGGVVRSLHYVLTWPLCAPH